MRNAELETGNLKLVLLGSDFPAWNLIFWIFFMAYPQFSVVPAGTLYLPAGTRFPTDESAGYFQPSLSGFFSAHRLTGFACKTFPVIFPCLSRRDIRK